MSKLLSRGLAFAAVFVCASLACGGRVDPGDDGGAGSSRSSSSSSGAAASGSGSSGASGSSGSVIVPPCPNWPPTAGTACVGPNGCAYYTNGGCEAFLCNTSGAWESTPEGC